jgi:hypothetical protein
VPKTLGAEAQKRTNVDFAAQWDNTQLEPAEFLKEELNLGFGKYRLQVQVPERGAIINPFRLVGETIAISITGPTKLYFASLEPPIQRGFN